MATPAVSPQATAWDVNGNPVAPSGPTAWDANGNPTARVAKLQAAPAQSTGTIGPAPSVAPQLAMDALRVSSDPMGSIGNALDLLQQKLAGSDHPLAREAAQHMLDAKELLFGGQAAGKPMGTKSGVVNNPVTTAMSLAPAAAEAAPALTEGIENLASRGAESIRSIKPMIRRAVFDPVTGEPTLTPTSIAKRVLRDPKAIEDAAYEAKAQALMDRGYEQAKLDMAHEQRLNAIEDSRQKELADLEKLKEQQAQSIERRGRQQGAIDVKDAREAEKTAKASQPKITTPQDRPTPRVGNEGRGATWKTEDLYKMIQNPDLDIATKREAISQLVLRGKELPPNARYIMGDVTHGSATYNPRDVTKFTPEGVPLRQGGKKLTEVGSE